MAMTTGKGSSGFTIVETVIVLGVTSLAIAMALGFVSGKQRKTEFHQAVNDIQSQISEVISNVQNGYYAKTDDFDCNDVGGHPNINFASTSNLGTNEDCTYIGRAIQFWVQPDSNTFKVYSLVGVRNQSGTNIDVQNIVQANPRVIFKPPNGPSTKKLLYGLEIVRVKYGINNGPISSNAGTIAFISSFGQAITGGSGTINMYAIQNTSLNQQDNTAQNRLDNNNAGNYIANTTGITICFDGGSNLFGIITIGGKNAVGGSNRPLNSTLQFANKPAAPGSACS